MCIICGIESCSGSAALDTATEGFNLSVVDTAQGGTANFKWGNDKVPKDDYIEVLVDTDVAGCAQTRRSTSGGMMLYHGHCVKHWPFDQLNQGNT